MGIHELWKYHEIEVFTYHEVRRKKTAAKKLFGITIDEHLNFNEHITNACKSTSKKLSTALSRMLSLLRYQQKKIVSKSFISGQSIIVLLFGFLILSGPTGNSTNYMTGFYD